MFVMIKSGVHCKSHQQTLIRQRWVAEINNHLNVVGSLNIRGGK